MGELKGKTSASSALPFGLGAPGGFEVKGACNLEGIRELSRATPAVNLAMFVRHGLHTTKHFFPENCTILERHKITLRKTNTPNRFYP